MSNNYFSSASDAATFMVRLLRNDYFQDFTDEDRIQDPDNVYAISAKLKNGEGFYFSDKEREALTLFSKASPEERAELFEIWG